MRKVAIAVVVCLPLVACTKDEIIPFVAEIKPERPPAECRKAMNTASPALPDKDMAVGDWERAWIDSAGIRRTDRRNKSVCRVYLDAIARRAEGE